MKMHETITQDRIMEAIERGNVGLDNPGFCIECGEERDGCEPDARRYLCDACGKRAVYGAEELLLQL